MISFAKSPLIRWLLRINIFLFGVAIVIKADGHDRKGYFVDRCDDDDGYHCEDLTIRKSEQPEYFNRRVRNDKRLGMLIIVLVLLEPGFVAIYNIYSGVRL